MRKKCLMVIWSVSIIVAIVGSPAMQAQAYSAKVSYFFEGIDLDLGTVEVDPTILVVTMGETIDDMLSPSSSDLDDFSPATDLSFDFNPVSKLTITVMLHHAAKVASITDIAFQEIDHTALNSLEWLEGQKTLSFPADTSLIVWTAENQFVKLRLLELSDFSVELACITLPPRMSVPELSTGFLVGVGLVVILRFIGRNKHNSLPRSVFVIFLFGGVSMASAQSSSITVVKAESTGDGTILYGENKCSPGCRTFTIPYTERRGVVLKAVPDQNSRFVQWNVNQQQTIQGELNVQPGDTIVAVFQNKCELFYEIVGYSPPADLIRPPMMIRERYVRIFPEVLQNSNSVIFNLFDDVSLEAVTESLEQYSATDFCWTGSVSEYEWGNAASCSLNGKLYGTIDADGFDVAQKRVFSIMFIEKGVYGIFELDYTAFQKTFPFESRLNSSDIDTFPSQKDNKKNNLQGKIIKGLWSIFTVQKVYAQSAESIDLMVLYTSDAKQASRNAIESQIRTAIAQSNVIFRENGVSLYLHPVHVQEINFRETGNLEADLMQLKQIEEVQLLRNRFQADLVSLWVESGDACGRAEIMEQNDLSSSDKAFSVFHRLCLDYNKTAFMHELSHNMGARHDWYVDQHTTPYPYSHGQVIPCGNKCLYTIMAYPNGCYQRGYDGSDHKQIRYFSNPSRRVRGECLMGVPEGEEKPVNNWKTLNKTAKTVAAYRPLSEFSWSIDMPGGTISSCDATLAGQMKCVYLVDTPDYETRTSPISFISISYAGNSGGSPVQIDAHQVSGTGGLPAQSDAPVTIMIDWVIYSGYHGHWKNLTYYL